MKPLDLIKTALYLAMLAMSKRPRISDLCRAVSTIYYAYFRTLCQTIADLWVGATPEARSRDAWRKAFRSLQHGRARDICANQQLMSRFPIEARKLAKEFVIMYDKRIQADYHYDARFKRSEVISDAKLAKKTIEDFMKLPREVKLDFVTMLALPDRRN